MIAAATEPGVFDSARYSKRGCCVTLLTLPQNFSPSSFLLTSTSQYKRLILGAGNAFDVVANVIAQFADQPIPVMEDRE